MTTPSDGTGPAIRSAAELQVFRDRLQTGDITGAQAIQHRFWQGEFALSQRDSIQNTALLPWDQGFDPAPVADFLFVSGPPRSGTTALGRLMLTHPDATLFIELYGGMSGYVPQMFARANITRLLDAGLVKPLRERNVELMDRASLGAVIGDKRPNFMETAALTLANFAGRRVTVLHIVRNVDEVAASYLRRRENGTFPAHFDHVMAVAHANINNRNALALVGRLAPEHRMLVLDYATFWSDAGNAARVMQESGLDPARADQRGIRKLFNNAESLLERDRPLPSDALTYIEEHHDADAAAQLKALAFA